MDERLRNLAEASIEVIARSGDTKELRKHFRTHIQQAYDLGVEDGARPKPSAPKVQVDAPKPNAPITAPADAVPQGSVQPTAPTTPPSVATQSEATTGPAKQQPKPAAQKPKA